MLSHGLPRLGGLLCLPENGPLTQSPPRTREAEKTSHRGRVRQEEEEEEERGLVGVTSCWASMIKVSSGPNSRGRMGNSRALGLTWQFVRARRAAGDFYQIVNYPFRTTRAKRPNPLWPPLVAATNFGRRQRVYCSMPV